MKILLVHPGGAIGWVSAPWSFTIPITLPYLAALTPPDIQVEVRYLGQNTLDQDYEVDYDLVGISALTTYANAAFTVADRFRGLGRKVVIGGVHATMAPDKTMEHCDAVVIGEAEGIWSRVLEDAANHNLKKLYKDEHLPDFNGIPSPRFQLLDLGRTAEKIYYPVLSSKGCPNRCEYCFVPELFGGRLRHRPIEDVLRDIQSIIETMNGRRIAFVDDNIIGNRRRAKELFKEMIPSHVKWSGELDLLVNLKIIQWPRLKGIPLVSKTLYPLKSLLKARLSS